MSIQTELTRLTNAKAAIQAAIEGKGVTVPSGTLLDGMAALIDAIEAGGGEIEAQSGTFILSSSVMIYGTDGYTLSHGLSGEPDFFALVFDHFRITNGVMQLFMYSNKFKYIDNAVFCGVGSNGPTVYSTCQTTAGAESITIISNNEKITNLDSGSVYSSPYRWIAVRGIW